MEFFPSREIFVSFGNIGITWYAILIMSGAIVAYLLSRYNTKKMAYPDNYIDDIFVDVLWSGILGARLWYCIFYDFNFYISHPLEIIKIWDGGLAIQGGVIAALIYGVIYTRKKGLNLFRLADAILPNVLLAQAIGRWGNYINQECHGVEVSESYFDGILSFIKDGMCINGIYYEPMFLYESILCVVGFILIAFVLKKYQNKRGDLMWAYFMWYGVIRFFIEGHRTDALMLGPLKMAQITSVLFLIVGILGYLGFFEKLNNNSKPAILFDLDGTLIDTEKGIHASYEYVFNKHGHEFTNELRKEVLGPSLDSIFKKYIPEVDSDILIDEYRIHNKEVFKSQNKLMDNCESTIKALKEDGYHLAVVSTKAEEVCKWNLEIYGLDKYFDDVIGGEGQTKFKLKPDPESLNIVIARNHYLRDEIIYIGDSVSDIEAGKRAGAYTIGFYFNKDKKDDLDKAGANEYIYDLKDLLGIVKKDIHFTYFKD